MGEAAFNGHVGCARSAADFHRRYHKQFVNGKIILPFTVPPRAEPQRGRVGNVDPMLSRVAGQGFYSLSLKRFRGLLGDLPHIAGSLIRAREERRKSDLGGIDRQASSRQ